MAGSLSQDLLDFLILNDDFLKKSPPKSTGRERYGLHYVEKLCEKAKELDLHQADVVRTATGSLQWGGIASQAHLYQMPNNLW